MFIELNDVVNLPAVQGHLGLIRLEISKNYNMRDSERQSLGLVLSGNNIPILDALHQ